MKRTGKIKWGNMKIGIVISIAVAAILYSSFSGGGVSIFTPKDELVAYFSTVNGLLKGASIRLSGVEVGTVKSVEFVNLDPERRIKVVMRVRESVWPLITEDSKVQLGTIGLLGDKYIEIFPGSPDKPPVESGGVLGIKEEFGLDAIVQQAPAYTSSVDTLLINLKNISKKLAGDQGTAGKIISDTTLYTSLMTVLDQTADVMAEIGKNQKDILEKLNSTLNNTANITAKMDSGQGSLGQMLNDNALYNNAASSAGRLDSILAKIDRGDGSAGALINDAQLYEEIRNLIVRINNLIADIEANPRKYFKFSVF
jgi:phospholipid/cholesterol/gamma-HCH transport system substrate-binding protein